MCVSTEGEDAEETWKERVEVIGPYVVVIRWQELQQKRKLARPDALHDESAVSAVQKEAPGLAGSSFYRRQCVRAEAVPEFELRRQQALTGGTLVNLLPVVVVNLLVIFLADASICLLVSAFIRFAAKEILAKGLKDDGAMGLEGGIGV